MSKKNNADYSALFASFILFIINLPFSVVTELVQSSLFTFPLNITLIESLFFNCWLNGSGTSIPFTTILVKFFKSSIEYTSHTKSKAVEPFGIVIPPLGPYTYISSLSKEQLETIIRFELEKELEGISDIIFSNQNLEFKLTVIYIRRKNDNKIKE